MTSDEMPGADPEQLLGPDSTSSGYEGVSAATLEQYQLRRRMMAGDELGVDIVERLLFHGEREHQSPGRIQWPLMVEAAGVIAELRRQLEGS